jgi:hypothetical protein
MLPIVLGNFARQSRRRSSFLGEWLAPNVEAFRDSNSNAITPWYYDTNVETLRRNVQQLN